MSRQDPALSNLFNLVTTQNRLGQSTSSTTTIGQASNSGNGQVSYYTVDSKGDIMFPVVGVIHIAGLTREQVAAKIMEELVSRDLVKDPIVTVEFANAGVSIIGEVAHPGRFEFNKDHVTIIDAIAMAGDRTIKGDLEPNDKKKRETTPNGNTPYTPSFWLTMGSFAVTIATLVITITN